MVFEPNNWKFDISGALNYARDNALFIKEDLMAQVEAGENPQILVMTTCSSEFTDARTIVMAYMKPVDKASN